LNHPSVAARYLGIPTITRIKIHNMRETVAIATFQSASELRNLELRAISRVLSEAASRLPLGAQGTLYRRLFSTLRSPYDFRQQFLAADFLHSLERGAALGACGLSRPQA
jgi:hypothetical protein